MNNEPLVSICSITYNHAPFIRQCLDGFLMQQTNFPIEIVINDDCSTDGTTEIIREYAEKYPDKIFPIFHDQNLYSQGVRGMFLKYVFPKVRGKYFALCEGDDYWTDPQKLQKQVDFLEAHPEYSMCFHRTAVIYEDVPQEATDWYSGLEEREYTAEEVLTPPCVPTASQMVRAEIISKIPDHPDFHAGDIIVHATACSCGKAYCMGDTMAVYRRHSGSWTYANEVAKDLYILGIPHYLAMLELFPGRIMKGIKKRTAVRCVEWIKRYREYKDRLPFRYVLKAFRYCNIELFFELSRRKIRLIKSKLK